MKLPFQRKENYPNSSNDVHEQLEAVIEINRALVGILDLNQTLDLITHKLVSVIDVSFASIFVWDEDNQRLITKSVSLPSSAKTLIENALRKPIESVVFSTSNPDHLKNHYLRSILEEEKFTTNSLLDLSAPFIKGNVVGIVQRLLGMKTAFTIPLLLRNEKIGVLGLIWNKESISPDQEKLISTFSDQIINAVYNSRLFSQVQSQVTFLQAQNRDLASLYRLASSVSKSLNPVEVSNIAVNSIPKGEKILSTSISLIENETKSLRVVGLQNSEILDKITEKVNIGDLTIPLDSDKFQNNSSIIALKTAKPYFSTDLARTLSPPLPEKLVPWVTKLTGVKSVYDFPIISRGNLVGVATFYLFLDNPNQITKEFTRLLQTYTNQIAIALDNAKLFTFSQITQRNLQLARQRERDMLDVMGHELRTPITVVRNSLLVLQKEIDDKGKVEIEKLKKYVEMGIESARREIRLVETLLTTAKMEGKRIQLHYVKTDMKDVINDSLEALKGLADQKHLEIKVDMPNEEIFAYADRDRTQEIMDNFLSNAIKYTGKGVVEIKLEKREDTHWIIVKDTGVGISQKDLDKLGNKFFRAKSLYSGEHKGIQPSGTGLGLYVTFELIRVMGGEKIVESEEGKGSVFGFGLPHYNGEQDVFLDQTFMDNTKDLKLD